MGVEVSSGRIRYGFFEKKDKQFFLTKRGTVSVKETVPTRESLSDSIGKIISRSNISPAKIFVTVFRDDMTTQQVVLPRMPDSEIAEVVIGEIEKIPAFSNREFEYIFERSDMEGNKVKVVFAAVFKEIINAVTEGIKQLKLPLGGVELAPLSMAGVVAFLNKGHDDALVILDETATYIAVFSRKECRFFYTSNTGKNELYSDGGQRINATVLANWASEIKRIFKSYALEAKGSEVGDIWFVWDNENAKDLGAAFGKELGKEVRHLAVPAVQGFADKESSPEDSNPAFFVCSAPVIAHLKGLKNEFSFARLLRETTFKKTVKQIAAGFFIYCALCLLVFGVMYAGVLAQKKDIGRKTAEVNSRIAALEKETRRLAEKQAQAESIKERLLRQAEYVRDLNRVSWSRVFGEVAGELPEDVCLVSFNVVNYTRVDLKGQAFQVENVSDIVRRLDKSAVLQNAKFHNLREAKVDDKKIFNFGIFTSVRKNTPEGNVSDDKKP